MSPSDAFMAIAISDFNRICRICLEKSKLCPIQRTFIKDRKVADLLEYSVMSDVKNEILPQNICHKCLNELYKFWKFIKQCQDNEAMLKNLLENDIIVEDFKVDIKQEILEPSNNENKNSDVELNTDDVEKINIKEDDETDANVIGKPTGVTTNKRSFNLKCNKCDYRGKDPEDIQQHRKNYHLYLKCEICMKMIERRRHSQHMKYHTKPYKCEICLKNFGCSQNLRRHKVSHTGERPYLCGTCGKGFKRSDDLAKHEDSQHAGKTLNRTKRPGDSNNCESAFLCCECGKLYRTKYGLQIHSRMHRGEKLFTCNVCEKAFVFYSNLRVHMRRHTGDRPYKCSLCPKAFTAKTVLVEHMRFKHTGEKPFSCTICIKKFATKRILKIHIRSHTGEKPHVCRICGKDFADKCHLRVHLRMHIRKRDIEQAKSEMQENEQREIIGEETSG